jgi:hypothetical protein
VKHSSVFTVLVLALTASASAQSKWQSLTSKECGFTAEFPGKPKSEFRSLHVEGGDIEYRSYEYDRNRHYVLGITCNRITDEGSKNPEALLDSVRDAAIEKLHATKGREMRLLVQGHPARLVELSADGFSGYGEMVVANGMYYQVLAMPESKKYAAIAKRFLSSFKLLK